MDTWLTIINQYLIIVNRDWSIEKMLVSDDLYRLRSKEVMAKDSWMMTC